MLKEMKRRLRQSWPLVLAIAAASALAAFSAERLGWLAPVDDVAYDQALRWFTPNAELSSDVVVLAIDDTTFRGVARDDNYKTAFGAWPYSRNIWARVVKYLGARGARAVVFDAVINEPHPDTIGDLQLAQELRDTRVPFFLGFAVNADAKEFPALPRVEAKLRRGPLPPKPGAPAADAAGEPSLGQDAEPPPASPEEVAQALAFPVVASGFAPRTLLEDGAVEHPVPPISPLVPVVTGFGLVTPEEDGDGKMRRTRFAYADESNAYAVLPVAAAAHLFGADRLELSPGTLKLGGRALAINRDGSARIDYGGRLQARFPPISLLRVLQDLDKLEAGAPPLIPDALFRGKVVLIGGTAVGTSDVKATPFDSSAPGLSKQAALLDNLLRGGFITDAPWAVSLAVAFLVALVAFTLIFGLRALPVELGVPVLSAVLVFTACGAALARGHVYLPIVTPLLALALASGSAIVVNHLFADRERERVRAMFGQYLSKHVVSQLVEQESLPELAGENMLVTAFFSDIRGFSTFSERYMDDPRGLVAVLNTYLTRVSAVLLDHGACLDKYIGDAIVCIFGAPVRHEDHAVRACRGALAAQAEVARIRAEFREQGLPDVYTRIGLNSANMFVGNVGSAQLFNYTAIGDGMNLAARLEGANKNYGSGIMIGPRTYELARDAIEVRELDRVRVAGKTEAVAVYELLGMKGELSLAKRQLVELYHQALALYRDSRFAQARDVLEQALALEPEDGPSQALHARCKKYLLHPPPSPFDGVVNLEK